MPLCNSSIVDTENIQQEAIINHTLAGRYELFSIASLVAPMHLVYFVVPLASTYK